MEPIAFSYATASDGWWKRGFIRLVEKATGQPRLEALYRRNQRAPRPDESFWQACVRSLGVDVRFHAASLAALPKTGPLVIVANHPFGVLDGILACWLVEKVRPDFVVITHSALLRAPEVRPFVLPIDFAQTPQAQATNLATRAAARAQLDRGGVVIVFPAGMISTSPDRLGRRPAVDARWQPFVAQLIQRSKATVAPMWFEGQNSRLFQAVSHFSATLRLALIFREVRTRIGASLFVAIGEPIPFDDLCAIKDRQALVDRLYALTYGLASARRPLPAPPATERPHRAEEPSLVEAGRSA